MSYSRDCLVFENSFVKNEIVGAKLIDCSGNKIYHNSFLLNGFNQNAVDNGENLWDLGPLAGGNFWSDHEVSGNPGNEPKTIPSSGVDNYPFQSPVWGM
jgi:parallel beta-helix repeat protein